MYFLWFDRWVPFRGLIRRCLYPCSLEASLVIILSLQLSLFVRVLWLFCLPHLHGRCRLQQWFLNFRLFLPPSRPPSLPPPFRSADSLSTPASGAHKLFCSIFPETWRLHGWDAILLSFPLSSLSPHCPWLKEQPIVSRDGMDTQKGKPAKRDTG